MRHSHVWVFAVVAMLASFSTACGGNTTTAPSNTVLDSANSKLSAQSASPNGGRLTTLNSDPCGDVTYVGPVRPISVHGTTFYISWLGSDNPVRGYEVQWELDVNNVYIPAGSTVVVLPEASIHVTTEGTYRFRVRGLFCNEQIGPWTDWQVKGTDDTEDHKPIIVDPLPPPCVVNCEPPPCLVDCEPPPPPPVCGEGTHLDGLVCVPDPPPPPPDPQTTFCHVTAHSAPFLAGNTLTLPLSAVLNGHIGHHPHDYYGACTSEHGHDD